jgi:hypothetical protein
MSADLQGGTNSRRQTQFETQPSRPEPVLDIGLSYKHCTAQARQSVGAWHGKSMLCAEQANDNLTCAHRPPPRSQPPCTPGRAPPGG